MQEVRLRELSSVLSPYWEREPDKGRYSTPIIAATAYRHNLLQPLASNAAMLLPASLLTVGYNKMRISLMILLT